MKKLELKHLAPYLPYELKVQTTSSNITKIRTVIIEEYGSDELIGISHIMKYQIHNKPILRPLSDLTKEIEVNGEKFVPYIELLRVCNFDVDNMSKKEIENYNPNKEYGGACPMSKMYVETAKLFEWHFDVFNLIEKGLAIDINTL